MDAETKDLDCFFFVDMDDEIPEEERCIETLCVECRNEKYPDTGWFHRGSELGYAEGAAWECKVCGKSLSYVEEIEAAY